MHFAYTQSPSPQQLWMLALALYFVPWFIARKGKKPITFFVANLAFGWTVIGWLAILVWAVAEREKEARENAQN